jgi:hypothetical protein
MQVEIVDGSFVVDAALIGKLLHVADADVQALLLSRAITSICEAGVGTDQGTFRLNFFHQTRRAILRIDATGRVLQSSVIDFGKRPAGRIRHRAAKNSLDGSLKSNIG